MRKLPILLASIISVFSFSARAADMTGAEIKTLISGNTAYLELNPGVPAGTGQGVIYYSPDGKATFKTPAGPIWDGPWEIKDNTVCIVWKQMAGTGCTRYDKDGATITLINTLNGKPRGKLVKVEKGNPEKL
jgi:hypothetical protein